MSYWEELWKFKKKDSRYHFYKKIPVDDPSAIQHGQVFVIKQKNGNEARYRIDRVEHLFTLKTRKLDKYDEDNKNAENEYFIRIFISR